MQIHDRCQVFMNSSKCKFQWRAELLKTQYCCVLSSLLTANQHPGLTQTLPCSVHMFTFGSSVGPSRCCCFLPSQTRLHFPPTAEIRDHRGSIRACLTWHFLVRGWTDSFTPLCPFCHMSTLQFTTFVLSVQRVFLGTMFSLLHCI